MTIASIAWSPGEQPSHRLSLRHQRRYFDALVGRVKPDAARAETIDGRNTQGTRGTGVAAAADERRLAVAETLGACAPAVLRQQVSAGFGPLERQSSNAALQIDARPRHSGRRFSARNASRQVVTASRETQC